jgi:hypothetical protein
MQSQLALLANTPISLMRRMLGTIDSGIRAWYHLPTQSRLRFAKDCEREGYTQMEAVGPDMG